MDITGGGTESFPSDHPPRWGRGAFQAAAAVNAEAQRGVPAGAGNPGGGRRGLVRAARRKDPASTLQGSAGRETEVGLAGLK